MNDSLLLIDDDVTNNNAKKLKSGTTAVAKKEKRNDKESPVISAASAKLRCLSGTVGTLTSCSTKYCKSCVVQIYFCSECWKGGEWLKFKHEADCELQRERMMFEQLRLSMSRHIESLEARKKQLEKEMEEKEFQVIEGRKMITVFQKAAEIDLEKRREAEDDVSSSLREISSLKLQSEEAEIRHRVAIERQSKEMDDAIKHMKETEKQLCKRLGELENELERQKISHEKEKQELREEAKQAIKAAEEKTREAVMVANSAEVDAKKLLSKWRQEQSVQESTELELLNALEESNQEKHHLRHEIALLQKELEVCEQVHKKEMEAMEERAEEDISMLCHRFESEKQVVDRRLTTALEELAKLQQSSQSCTSKYEEELIRLRKETQIQTEITQRCSVLSTTLIQRELELDEAKKHIGKLEDQNHQLQEQLADAKSIAEAADARRLREARAQTLLASIRASSTVLPASNGSLLTKSRESSPPSPTMVVANRKDESSMVVVDIGDAVDTPEQKPFSYLHANTRTRLLEQTKKRLLESRRQVIDAKKRIETNSKSP